MNMLSTCAYNVSSQAKKSPNCTITRAQTFELIAAFLGKNSFAALKKSSITQLLEQVNTEPLIAFERCKLKALTLNQSQTVSTQLASLIRDQLASLNFKQSPLVNRQALHYLSYCDSDEFDDWDESEPRNQIEAESVDSFKYKGFEVNIKALFAELQQSSRAGDKESKLLEFLWLLGDLPSVSSDESSQHWYEQSIKGHKLGEAQQSWADNYEKQIKPSQALKHFINNTTIQELAQPNVDQLIESRGFQSINESICYSLNSQEIMNIIDNYWEVNADCDTELSFFKHWSRLSALQQPSRESLAGHILQMNDPVEQHSWARFAKEHGIDVTKDDHYAIDTNTGELWDADYDAPIEVCGFDGVTLNTLPKVAEPQVEARTTKMLELNKQLQKLV
ncbi:hypothetical protein [Shewanella benthica]|uniref:Uncharacterized protein n=1 Tax=Shewanella benthica KT99 TaxID=314608 RepID=A9DA96_9GAMM|nr:hypothetical protein [Shewanella benthica]EDQ00728.1 hypothetical protein KT99_15912 [Shewanella benthica KT99]